MKKILILSHQGMGFVNKLVHSAKAMGGKFHVLSSHLTNNESVKAWRQSGWNFTVSDHDELTDSDVTDLHSVEQFDCCITVWDAYRPIMAQANALFGANDLTPETVDLIQDKYVCRKAMFNAGLSNVDSFLLSDIEASGISIDDGQYFVKPRRGAGSYFALLVRNKQHLEEILHDFECRSKASEPAAFHGFLSSNQLYLEPFIDGHEFSFEIILSDGEIQHCVEHEKVMDTDEHTDVAIECAFFSPSKSVSQEQIRQAYLKITSMFELLSIKSGCFHVELRYTPSGHWELIEINLRIGGAYIDESVQCRLNKQFLVEQLALLLGTPSPIANADHAATAVYFEIAFAQAGQRIESYRYNSNYVKHNLEQLFYKPGELTDNTKAEIMCGQHLWTMSVDAQTAFLQRITGQRYLQVNG